MNTKEREFHVSRVAFAVINDKLSITCNDSRSHKEWLKEDYNIDEDTFETVVRGYMKDDKIVFYKGSNFSYDDEVCEMAKKYVNGIKELFQCEAMNIYVGVIVGNIGEEWEPDKLLFTVEK